MAHKANKVIWYKDLREQIISMHHTPSSLPVSSNSILAAGRALYDVGQDPKCRFEVVISEHRIDTTTPGCFSEQFSLHRAILIAYPDPASSKWVRVA
jgi:hypothetical protein